jgi:hypothetical protein
MSVMVAVRQQQHVAIEKDIDENGKPVVHVITQVIGPISQNRAMIHNDCARK